MRRWYKMVSLAPTEGGMGVKLDDKWLASPAGHRVVLTTEPLAEAIAAEWRTADGEIAPARMPLTRFIMTALDRVAPRRAEAEADLLRYAETDLLCHRAPHPAELADRQEAAWRPLLDWAAERFGARLAIVSGVMPVAQPTDALARFAEALRAHAALGLVLLQAAAAATGSLVLAFALIEQRIDAGEAWRASQIEEAFQIEQWGADEEAEARRQALRAELEDVAHMLALSRPTTAA